MKIIVTGSLGHISRPLTMDLIAKGHEVVVISSTPDRKAAIEHLGASAAIGSLEDKTFITATFKAADAAYCMVPPDMSQPDQIAYYERIGTVYAQAIRQTGVRRVVHLSSYGAHLESETGFITGSHRIEGLLNALPDLLLTHVRPTSFYYNLLAYIPMIKATGFMGDVYGGDDRFLMVAPQDIAGAVSEEIIKTAPIDPVRYVNGDERSCNAVAAVLGTAIGIPDLQWKVLPREAVFNALVGNHLSEHAATMLLEVGAAIHSGRLREDINAHVPVSGKIKLADFAQDFARAYHQYS